MEQVTESIKAVAVEQSPTTEEENHVPEEEPVPEPEPVQVPEPMQVPEPVQVSEPVQIVEPVKKTEQVHTVRKPTVRRLNQVEAVVLPSNQTVPLSTVNVQFGSLNLSNGEEKPIEPPVVVEIEAPIVVEVIKTPIVEKVKTPVVQKQEPIKQTPVIEQSQPAGLVAHKAPLQPQPQQEYMNYNHVVPEYNMYSTMEQRMVKYTHI